MKQEVLSQFDLPWLPVTALFIFLICFACYCYWALKKDNKKKWDHISELPLSEEKRISHE
jgi:cbb3-type cytochrome oxidase subunit 3